MIDMRRPSLKMIAVSKACNDAPPGPQKNEAVKHFAAAVEARVAMREAESNKELDAATEALAWLPSPHVTAGTAFGVKKRVAVLISRVGQYGSGMPQRTLPMQKTFQVAFGQISGFHNRGGMNSSLTPTAPKKNAASLIIRPLSPGPSGW